MDQHNGQDGELLSPNNDVNPVTEIGNFDPEREANHLESDGESGEQRDYMRTFWNEKLTMLQRGPMNVTRRKTIDDSDLDTDELENHSIRGEHKDGRDIGGINDEDDDIHGDDAEDGHYIRMAPKRENTPPLKIVKSWVPTKGDKFTSLEDAKTFIREWASRNGWPITTRDSCQKEGSKSSKFMLA